MRVNARSVFLCAREGLRQMLAQSPHGGTISNIASVAAMIGIGRRLPYCASKLEASQGEQALVGSGHQTPLKEEVRRLKRELDVVRQERDLLKKVVGIFSREPR